MNVIKNFLNSEKAIFVGLLVIAATVLAALGKMTVDQWIAYTEWMAVTYVAGKTVHGAAVAISGKPASAPDLVDDNDSAADKALIEKFPVKKKDA